MCTTQAMMGVAAEVDSGEGAATVGVVRTHKKRVV
jgi:hypothetical protein